MYVSLPCILPTMEDAVMLAMNLKEPAVWLRMLIYVDQIS